MALLLRVACASLSLFLCSAVPLVLSPSKYAGSMHARTLHNGSAHREKRQLSEIVYALTSGARLIIGAGVGLLQSVGRIGKEVVGESDGGLLGLLSSLFTGVNVSLDLVRNVLLAVLGTKDILLGTPSKDELTAAADPLADHNS
ncbi:uncharacterized protein [Dermacentor albipictus]|uniref:uncharacterized protein n=1 Tax=Dermacentor albipictus TaxID=60249 RepID=UPI0038FD2460